MAVNRTIHAETERLLCKRNSFVIAWHKLEMDDMAKLMREMKLWVPLITCDYTIVGGNRQHHALAMRHCSLAINFTYSSGLLPAFSAMANLNNTLEIRTCIFLAADLDSYCSVLSELLERITGPKLMNFDALWPPFIVSLPDAQGRSMSSLTNPDGSTRPAPRPGLALYSTTHRKINRQHQTSLLAPFRNVIGASMRVLIEGDVVDNLQVESVKKHMGPSLTCMLAEYWACFERLEMRKAIADSTALGGELHLALNMYERLRFELRRFMRTRDGMLFPRTNIRFVHIFKAFGLLNVDTYLSEAYVVHKFRQREYPSTFNEMIPPTLMMLISYYNHRPGLSYNPEPLKCLAELAALDMADAESDSPPLRCINFRHSSGLARKPRYIIGWTDVRMLSQVSAIDRARTNSLQSRAGLIPIPWSEFDDAMG